MHRTRLLIAVILPLLLVSACAKKSTRGEAIIGSETVETVMPTGKNIVHPVHGREEWFAIGPMSGESPVNANGMVQSHVFADGTSTATITLNIAIAPKNSRYVAWLRKPGSVERLRLDVLQNPLKDVRYAATVEIDKDVRAYTEAIVTLEKIAGPSDSDPIQATGTLTERKR